MSNPVSLGTNLSFSGTTCAVSVSIANAGSLLIVTVSTNVGIVSAVTDTKGNTFTSRSLCKQNGAFNWMETFTCSANNGSGADTVTATVVGSNALHVAVIEWQGQAGSPFDGAANTDSQTGTSMTSGASSGSSTNTQDLVFGVGICSAATIAAGSGFTELVNETPFAAPIVLEYKFGAGNSAATATASSSVLNGMSVVTLKSAPNPWYAYAQQ